MTNVSRAVRIRRSQAIHAFCGPNGSGKTLLAVQACLPSLEAGRPVLSTCRLLDYENPRPCEDVACDCDKSDPGRHRQVHPLYIPWTRWPQLLEVERCDVLADEITGVASSRSSGSLPAVIANALVQLRKRDVVFRWTSPAWARADLILRECTQAVTICRGFLPVDAEDAGRLWRPRRLVRASTYDASVLDSFTEGTRSRLKAMCGSWTWVPSAVERNAYDTLESVLNIGSVSHSGRCENCDGRRSAPACSCPDYVASQRAAKESAKLGDAGTR